jgi:catechol 2,3-dioxygenase-like lactoylglutathione lyase family enzyme
MSSETFQVPSVYFRPFFTELFRIFRKYRNKHHPDDNRHQRRTAMSRLHVALNTNRFEESIAFYSKLFGQPPAKQRDNWAKFDLADPALNLTLNRDDKTVHHGHINHLGVEVGDAATVAAMDKRLKELGLVTTPEDNVTCCYALQDKTWVTDPNGHAWEFFYVKGDA